MADTVKCVGCGKFIGYAEMAEGGGARHEFEPLSEFGPEVSEWVCADCIQRERREDERWAAEQSSDGAGWFG